MGWRDKLFGSGATQQAADQDAAAETPGNPAQPQADDAQDAAVDQSAISTEQNAHAGDEGLPPELTAAISTGNADLDARLKEEQQRLAAAYHRARQKDADKAKAERERGWRAADHDQGGERKPFELPRDAYKKHFETVGKYDDGNAKGLSDTVPDIVLDVIARATREPYERLERVERELADLRGVKAQHADSEWNKIRSTFGTAADVYRKDAEDLAREKGISLQAALVEASGGDLVRQTKAAQNVQKQSARPASLRNTVPASATPANGKPQRMSMDDLEDMLQQHKRSLRQQLREQ